MKHLKTFNENNSQKSIQIDETSEKRISELVKQFSINKEQATKLDNIIDEIINLDELEDRMDYVDNLFIEDELNIEDEDLCEEITEYLKDICID